MEPVRTREILILTGRVQGVGLRDQIVRIARGHAVAGTVRNLARGDEVEIDVEGEAAAISAFLADVLADLPSFAHVESLERKTAAPLGATGFRRESTRERFP